MPREMTVEEKRLYKEHPDWIFCLDESLTKQAFAEECDVNEILRRAANGQDVSGNLNARVAQYGDFTDVPDFQEAQNVVARARSMFMELPWNLRERFKNDPSNMLAFLQDDANYDEAVKLGLLDKDLVEARRAKAKEAEASAAAAAAEGEFAAESRPKKKAKTSEE